MSSDPSAPMGRAPYRMSERSNGDVATDNVTEQFRFMHVSGDCNNAQVENLAKNFMSTLGINDPNDTRYAEQLAALTKQVSMMMKPHEPTDRRPFQQARGFSETNLSSSGPNRTETSSRPLNEGSHRRGRSPGRRHRSRSRTPMGTRLKHIASAVRSKSPFRRDSQRSRSPNPCRRDRSPEVLVTDIGSEEKFYDSRMDVTSPPPKEKPKQSVQNVNTLRNPQPTSSLNTRPPLTSVNVSQSTTNVDNPTTESTNENSTFKFNKDQDKFNIGTSPRNSNVKFGSPGKKVRSPSHRPRPKTPFQTVQDNHPDISPLSDIGSLYGASPYPKSTSKPKTNGNSSSAPFFSPVPQSFHPPHAFVGSAGSRSIPSPHNIMQNDTDVEELGGRPQPSPSNAGSSAATGAYNFGNTNVRFDHSPEGTNVADTAPDTAETFIKKKTRNTATPVFNVESTTAETRNDQQFFNVDLASVTNRTKPKGRRGKTLRKGVKNSTATYNTTRSESFLFGLDEIKEVGTDETEPTSTESPSSGSAMSIDSFPIPTPMAQKQQQVPFAAKFNIGIGEKNTRTRSKRHDLSGRRAQYQRSQSAPIHNPPRKTFPTFTLDDKRKEILALKEEAGAFYKADKLKESIRSYTNAIEKYRNELFLHVPSKDLLGNLLWNRAAALMMVGAYESAVDDSRNGISYATDPRHTEQATATPDMFSSLRPKLCLRLGRSLCRLGRVDEAEKALNEAIQTATVYQQFYSKQPVTSDVAFDQIKNTATAELVEVFRLKSLLEKIDRANRYDSRCKDEIAIESLGHVTKALEIANGCNDLHVTKLQLLAHLKRWREVASHCERFAASNTRFDGCLERDLEKNNPFPGVPLAKALKPDFFGKTKEDELEGAEMKLEKQAASEAVLRLPFPMIPYYLRALRLEERFYVADFCISELECYIEKREKNYPSVSVRSQFTWLRNEAVKLRRTQAEKTRGDNLFSNEQFEEAEKVYAKCLKIDSTGECAGGRLNAVLHANRAAAFIGMKRHGDAMKACTAALRVYPRYLRALRRRGRAYSSLGQIKEAENDLNQWLDIVLKAKRSGANQFVGACIFDGPHKVSAEEIISVQSDLKELQDRKAREENEKKQQEKFQKKYSKPYGKTSPAYEKAYQQRKQYFEGSNSSSRQHGRKGPQKSKAKMNMPRDTFGYKDQTSSSRRSFNDSKKHYSLLGIDNRATDDEIRKAYKKMALKCHPDKNRDDPEGASKRFLKVQEAYETLSDPKARRKYDAETKA